MALLNVVVRFDLFQRTTEPLTARATRTDSVKAGPQRHWWRSKCYQPRPGIVDRKSSF